VDREEYRAFSYETWQAVAPAWEDERQRIAEFVQPATDWLIRELDAQPGEVVLELAAGVGDTGFAVATQLGDQGRLISTDFSPQMVESANRRAAALGLQNAECRVMDAEAMDLDDDSVNRVVCRFGYMLMADPEAALAETRRVLLDGGRLCFAVWTSPLDNPWAAVPFMTLVERGYLPSPEPGAPGMFAMADPERIESLLKGAGLKALKIEQVAVEQRGGSFDTYWDVNTRLAGPIAAALAKLKAEEREAVKGIVEERLAQFIGADGVAVPGLVHVVAAG
jgi:SAM-dependent methyltransferase